MMEFKAALVDFNNRLLILALARNGYGDLGSVAKPVEFIMVEHNANALEESPATFDLENKEAQSLINALWAAGLRPTDFKNPNGEINRLEAHLADLRKLVFEKAP